MLTKRCLLHTSHKRSRCWRRHPKLPTIETLLNITFGPPNHLPQNSPMKSHVLEAWIIVWNDKSSLFAIVKEIPSKTNCHDVHSILASIWLVHIFVHAIFTHIIVYTLALHQVLTMDNHHAHYERASKLS